MKMVRFIIQSLLAAGFFLRNQPAVEPADKSQIEKLTGPPLMDVLRLEHEYKLAAHRSHSSHSSHRSGSSSGGHGSHQSHRSSSPSLPSTPQREPSRNNQSTPPSSVLPSSPSTAPKTLPGTSRKFSEIVKQVQASLFLRGYYTGKYLSKIILIHPDVSACETLRNRSFPRGKDISLFLHGYLASTGSWVLRQRQG